ncbi:MAG: AraC family transcriptional regulator [Pseudomonadota bacterium]
MPQEELEALPKDETSRSLQHTCDGDQEVIALADDLIFARTDVPHIDQAPDDRQWSIDYSGWLYLHFRLEGLSREIQPDGEVTDLGGQSFILSVSNGPSSTREVLGEKWRTVGVACKPSFIRRELKMDPADLPTELARFQAGEVDAEFWYAGELSREMFSVAGALMNPRIHDSIRPIYIRAKAVELVCLALDRVRRPQPVLAAPIKLTQHDVRCLHQARAILEESPTAPTLDQLARRVGVNRNKLAMGFKYVFGETVAAFHREHRLEMAREMLRDPDVSVGQVADAAGYRDAGSFSKAFKLRYGMLPSDMRPGNRT